MKHRVIAALLTVLAASPALAQQGYPPAPGGAPMPAGGPMRGPRGGGGLGGGGGGGGGMAMLRMADTDGDGIVTRAEFVAAIDKRFDRLDANHDGVLSSDEMPMRGGGGRGRMAVDAPPPPVGTTGTAPAPRAPMSPLPGVTRDQYRAGAMRRFDRLDTNHDSRIDQAEMNAAGAMRPARAGTAGAAGAARVAAPPPPADQ